MKVFQAIAPKQGAFTEKQIPTPVEDQILVKVSYCGVCGTDYDLFSGESSFVKNKQATFPIRLGHEWSGVVAQVGPNVTRLKPGDRVVGDNYVSCGVCDACRAGDYNNCTGRNHVGTIDPCWPGAYAEYYLAPERHVYRLADHVSLQEASLCEPLSVAYGGIKKMQITEDTVVAVIGTGPIALSAAALALNLGGKVYVIGRNDFKLEIAQKLGIHGTINCSRSDVAAALKELTGGRLADCILECSGNPDMVGEVIRIDETGWFAYQMHRSDWDAGFVCAFRRLRADSDTLIVKLSGLQADVTYTVTVSDTGEVFTATGADLMRSGLSISIERTKDSRMIYYEATE